MSNMQKLTDVFRKRVGKPNVGSNHPKPKKKRPAPISLRLNDAELALLRKAASGRSINGYIRERLFGDGATISLPQPASKDHEALARVLGALGRTDVFSSLAAISLAMERHQTLASPEAEACVREACKLVKEMRSDLLTALGLRKG